MRPLTRDMIPIQFLLLVVITVLGGCATSRGLSADHLKAILQQEELRFAGSPSSTGSPPATGVPPRSNTPRLGLYVKPTGFLYREFEWTREDREAILTWSKTLPLGPEVRTPGFVSLSSLKGDSLAELRASAARYGVDWLLVFDGAEAVDRYNNYKAALLYWTIIGAYFVDGTHSDTLCVLNATLWDVKSGARLFDQQADGMTRTVGPAVLVDDRAELERARRAAIDTLLHRLTEQFATFLGTRR